MPSDVDTTLLHASCNLYCLKATSSRSLMGVLTSCQEDAVRVVFFFSFLKRSFQRLDLTITVI